MSGLMRAEWLKITRQGMSKVLLLGLVGVAALITLGMTWAAMNTGFKPQMRLETFTTLGFPDGLIQGLQFVNQLGPLVAAVFIANLIGSEYGLDTWKNQLIRQPGRGRFLAAKLVMGGLGLLALFALMVATFQGIGLLGHTVASDAISQLGQPVSAMSGEAFWRELGVSSAVVFFNVATMAAVATLFTVIGRSTVAGIMFAIVWSIVDGLAASLSEVSAKFSVMGNLLSLRENMLGTGKAALETWQNVAILGAYLVVPVVIALVIFRQRDMAG